MPVRETRALGPSKREPRAPISDHDVSFPEATVQVVTETHVGGGMPDHDGDTTGGGRRERRAGVSRRCDGAAESRARDCLEYDAREHMCCLLLRAYFSFF